MKIFLLCTGRVTRILLEDFKRAGQLLERVVVYDINTKVCVILPNRSIQTRREK